MHVPKTSQEINKMFGSHSNKFYRGKKMWAGPGYARGMNPVWLCAIAVKKHDDGWKCPHCGGKPNPDETDTYATHDEYDPDLKVNINPQIQTDTKCLSCGKEWSIRTNEGGAVVWFDKPRQEGVTVYSGEALG
jgi:DNA-directed RNA polymerase subunit RPC12/RpoP